MAGRHVDLLYILGFYELAEHRAAVAIARDNFCRGEVVLLRIAAKGYRHLVASRYLQRQIDVVIDIAAETSYGAHRQVARAASLDCLNLVSRDRLKRHCQ